MKCALEVFLCSQYLVTALSYNHQLLSLNSEIFTETEGAHITISTRTFSITEAIRTFVGFANKPYFCIHRHPTVGICIINKPTITH